MNSTKNKLFAAIAMLVVAAVAMTGTSFAWFTISTAPAVKNLDVEMAATRNFEIAAVSGNPTVLTDAPSEPAPGDSPDETKWGAVVSFSSSASLVFPMTITNGGTGTDDYYSVYYGETGRVDGVRKATLGTFNTSGVAYYMANIATTEALGSEVKVTCGAVYGVWLRSNVDCTAEVSMSGFTLKKGTTEVLATDDDYVRLSSAASVTAKFIDLTKAVGEAGRETIIEDGENKGMNANQAYLVYITVFFDGDYLYAKDIADGLSVTDFSIEFVNTNETYKDKMGTQQGTTYAPLMSF